MTADKVQTFLLKGKK